MQLSADDKKEKVNDLIKQLEINKKNGNISLPQNDLENVALFTMFVSSEEV